MNRSLVAVIACASLVASGLAAPMMHVHDDGDHVGGHHAGRVIHSHAQLHRGAARHAPHGPALDNGGDDENARSIDLFQMVVGWSHPSPGLPPAIVSPPPPVPRAVARRLLVQHSHDPPFARTRPSRAPPRLPVLI